MIRPRRTQPPYAHLVTVAACAALLAGVPLASSLSLMGFGHDGYGETSNWVFPVMTWRIDACLPGICQGLDVLEAPWAAMREQTWSYQCPPDPCDVTSQGHKTVWAYSDYFVEDAKCEVHWPVAHGPSVASGHVAWRLALGGAVGFPLTHCNTTFTHDSPGASFPVMGEYTRPYTCRPLVEFQATLSWTEYQALAPIGLGLPEAPTTMAGSVIIITGTTPEQKEHRMRMTCFSWFDDASALS